LGVRKRLSAAGVRLVSVTDGEADGDDDSPGFGRR
jgi:hypothetical protein